MKKQIRFSDGSGNYMLLQNNADEQGNFVIEVGREGEEETAEVFFATESEVNEIKEAMQELVERGK
jgi:hypothetical protein